MLATITMQSWLSGGWAYNVLSLVLNIAGLLFGFAGLGFAFWQVRKAKDAAESARDAVVAVSARLNAFATTALTAKIVANWEQLRLHTKQRNFDAAGLRCCDVREALATARFGEHTGPRMSTKRWQSLLTDVATIERLLVVREPSSPSDETVLEILELSTQVSQRLAELNGVANASAKEITVTHADS